MTEKKFWEVTLPFFSPFERRGGRNFIKKSFQSYAPPSRRQNKPPRLISSEKRLAGSHWDAPKDAIVTINGSMDLSVMGRHKVFYLAFCLWIAMVVVSNF